MKTALILLLVAAIAGGGYYWYQGADTRYARQVMDCVFAGDFEPVKDTLNDKAKAQIDTPAVKAALPKFGEQMKQTYGETKSLKFKSEEPLKEAALVQVFGEGVVKKTWTATSDKGTFDWIMCVDKDGKLLSASPGRLTPL